MGPLITTYLSLGSNLGNRECNLGHALQAIGQSENVQVIRSSSVYETAPWGYTDQPSFLNCVAEVTTTLCPVQLLDLVKRIENDLGRKESFRYGPRVIDIDILLYGDEVISLEQPDLQIPHPRMTERAFVLIPLCDLASRRTHPKEKVSFEKLAETVGGREGIKLWGPPPIAIRLP